MVGLVNVSEVTGNVSKLLCDRQSCLPGLAYSMRTDCSLHPSAIHRIEKCYAGFFTLNSSAQVPPRFTCECSMSPWNHGGFFTYLFVKSVFHKHLCTFNCFVPS